MRPLKDTVPRSSTFAENSHVMHEDVLAWKHHPNYWPFVRGIREHLARFMKSTANKTLKLCVNVPLWGESTDQSWIPSKRDSDVASVSISWGHHNFIWGHTCIRKKTVSAIPCKQTKSAHPLTVTTATGTWISIRWVRISNYIRYKVWDEITYPLSNFNGCTVEVWQRISNFIPSITGRVITYPCRHER